MIRAILAATAALILFIVATVLHSQDRALVVPDMKVLLENERVRVQFHDVQAGQTTLMHSHPAYVAYVFNDYDAKALMADGRTIPLIRKAGDVFYDGPTTHTIVNDGKTPIHNLIVELKEPASASAVAHGDVAMDSKVKGSAGAAAALGIKVKPLLRKSLSGDDTKEVVMATGELPVGGVIPKHTHPGDEYATVLEGTLEILIDGQPPKRVNAGEAYHNARDVIHQTRNVGEVAVRIASTFVIDKGQPLMKPYSGQ